MLTKLKHALIFLIRRRKLRFFETTLQRFLRLLPKPRLLHSWLCQGGKSSRRNTEKCVEADIRDSAEMSSEDLDEGVMAVAFSDSDWERINYEEDSPIMLGSSATTEIIDDDGIRPCKTPEEDILYGSDIEDESNVDFCRAGGSLSSSGLDFDYWLSDSARLRIEAVKVRIFGNRHYIKYVQGNCMKQAALFTSLAVMLLPLILMVLVTLLSVSLVVSLCLLIPVIALGAGVVLTIMWNFWVSVPLFLMMAAVWIGADIFERLFKVPKKTVHSCHHDKK